MEFHDELLMYIKAGTPIILVSTKEINRAMDDIMDNALENYFEKLDIEDPEFYIWKITNGWTRYAKTGDRIVDDNLNDGEPVPPDEVIGDINKHAEDSIHLLVNYHWYLGEDADYGLIQLFLDNIEDWKGNEKRTLIILSPTYDIHPDLDNFIQHIPFKLPSKAVLASVVEELMEDYQNRLPKPNAKEMESILNAGTGLTTYEFEKAVAFSIIQSPEKRIEAQTIMNEKVKDINKNEMLTYWPPDIGMDSVGGMDILKEWLDQRKKATTPEAHEYGLPYPKGMLLLGIPGTGKSLISKSMSSDWQLPLIRLDLGKTFGPLVGDSERLTREVQELIEALSPCILWIDEAEKGFAGASGLSGDSGTSKRTFGSWLTWLQERPKDKLIYVVMTVNDIGAMPPELMRKGRFDEIWWLDAPDGVSREQIWTIHLDSRGKLTKENKAAMYDLVDKSNGFVGAEIEAAVEAAMFEAYYNDVEVAPKHLLSAIKDIKPVTELQADYIGNIRKRYEGAVRNAASGSQDLPKPKKAKVKLNLDD